MLFFRLLPVLPATLIVGCGTGTGPGSTADAVKFANDRITQLKQRATEEDEDGKWHCEAMELRNATPGFNQSTTAGITSVEATVEYEYRILRSGPHETKAEADSSKLHTYSRTSQERTLFSERVAGAGARLELA